MRRLIVPALLCLALAAPANAQDAAAGQRVFGQCRACHQVGETARNGIGPQLNGLFGRKAGSVPNYAYSEANANSSIVWDEASFGDYIRAPAARMPGTKMVYAGLKSDTQVTDLTAYLAQFAADGKPKAP